MDYINQAGKTELIIVGGIALVAVLIGGGFLTYETITNFDDVKEGVKVGKTALEASTGLPVIEHVIVPAGEKIVEGVKAPIEAVEDIIEGGVSFARERDVERSDPLAVQWLQIMGSDIYNDGFASLRYAALRENAEYLADVYKKSPVAYFRELPPQVIAPFIWPQDVQGDGDPLHRISPFKIRQHLDQTPFAGKLHGLAGTSATKLMHFVWTDYDEVPDKLANWNNLSESKKNDVIDLIREDRELLEAMEASNKLHTWIVRDRVINYNNLLRNYNITI